ncbi:hypothetical protein RIF29_24522 [Crotalaria pallida]|uniref:Uncharacterized protein n=1 Tax=Crotalaria pallida TaxID=3830 RepID=A0AAN9EQ39_CROPI
MKHEPGFLATTTNEVTIIANAAVRLRLCHEARDKAVSTLHWWRFREFQTGNRLRLALLVILTDPRSEVRGQFSFVYS